MGGGMQGGGYGYGGQDMGMGGMNDNMGSGQERFTYVRGVVVNGQPVRDDYVVTAEEHAGPIHPGNYW